jgi:hypothetical protein
MVTGLRTLLAEEPVSGKIAPALLIMAVLCHALPWEWQVSGTYAFAVDGFRSPPYGLASVVLAGAAAFCLLFLAAGAVTPGPARALRGVVWMLTVAALVCQALAFVPRERSYLFYSGAGQIRSVQIVYEVSPMWGLYVTVGVTALGLIFAVLRSFEGNRSPNQP